MVREIRPTQSGAAAETSTVGKERDLPAFRDFNVREIKHPKKNIVTVHGYCAVK